MASLSLRRNHRLQVKRLSQEVREGWEEQWRGGSLPHPTALIAEADELCTPRRINYSSCRSNLLWPPVPSQSHIGWERQKEEEGKVGSVARVFFLFFCFVKIEGFTASERGRVGGPCACRLWRGRKAACHWAVALPPTSFSLVNWNYFSLLTSVSVLHLVRKLNLRSLPHSFSHSLPSSAATLRTVNPQTNKAGARGIPRKASRGAANYIPATSLLLLPLASNMYARGKCCQ